MPYRSPNLLPRSLGSCVFVFAAMCTQVRAEPLAALVDAACQIRSDALYGQHGRAPSAIRQPAPVPIAAPHARRSLTAMLTLAGCRRRSRFRPRGRLRPRSLRALCKNTALSWRTMAKCSTSPSCLVRRSALRACCCCRLTRCYCCAKTDSRYPGVGVLFVCNL